MSQQPDIPRFAPRVLVQFDHPDRRYMPLDPLGVRYQVEGVAGDRVRAIEQSVLWYTEGKGEEDLGVHFFQRLVDQAAVAEMERSRDVNVLVDGLRHATVEGHPLYHVDNPSNVSLRVIGAGAASPGAYLGGGHTV